MTEIKEFRIGENWITAPNKSGTRWLSGVADEWRNVGSSRNPLWWMGIREGSYWIWREPMAAFISAVRTGCKDEPLKGRDWWIENNGHFEPVLYKTLWEEEIHIIPIHLSRLKPLTDSLNGKDNPFQKEKWGMPESRIEKGMLWGKRIDIIQSCKDSPIWEEWIGYVESETSYLNKILERYEEKK